MPKKRRGECREHRKQKRTIQAELQETPVNPYIYPNRPVGGLLSAEFKGIQDRVEPTYWPVPVIFRPYQTPFRFPLVVIMTPPKLIRFFGRGALLAGEACLL